MSFGRKGLAPGEVASMASRPATPVQSNHDAMAARREAFLAAERARDRATSNSDAATPDSPADPLAGLRNAARPATRRDDAASPNWTPLDDNAVRVAMQSRAGAGGSHSASGKRFVLGEPTGRSLTIAYLFWFIAGQISLHRFYCGQGGSATMQIGLLVVSLLMALVFAPIAAVGILAWVVWLFADLFLIPGMMRRFKAENTLDYNGVFA